MGRKRIAMDEESFVVDCAAGFLTYAQLGAKYGISRHLAGRIARGERRCELGERIAAAKAAAKTCAERELTRLAGKAVDALRVALAGPPSTLSVAAAREVLNRVLGRTQSAAGLASTARAAAAAPAEPPRRRSLMDLSPETKELVVAELGGPTGEAADMPYDELPEPPLRRYDEPPPPFDEPPQTAPAARRQGPLPPSVSLPKRPPAWKIVSGAPGYGR